jgi:hypothetical protein
MERALLGLVKEHPSLPGSRPPVPPIPDLLRKRNITSIPLADSQPVNVFALLFSWVVPRCKPPVQEFLPFNIRRVKVNKRKAVQNKIIQVHGAV